jgi:hypothetical protein
VPRDRDLMIGSVFVLVDERPAVEIEASGGSRSGR